MRRMMEELQSRDNIIINRLQTSELLLERERDKIAGAFGEFRAKVEEERQKMANHSASMPENVERQSVNSTRAVISEREREMEEQITSLKGKIEDLEDQRDSLATKLAMEKDNQARARRVPNDLLGIFTGVRYVPSIYCLLKVYHRGFWWSILFPISFNPEVSRSLRPLIFILVTGQST